MDEVERSAEEQAEDKRRAALGAALDSDDWTEGEKFVLKWQWRMNGGFYTSLIETMCRADDENLGRLAMSFPSLALAIADWKNGDLAQRLRAVDLID